MTTSIRVVIPAHNASATIGETLRSLAEQDDRHFAVTVVDDHSTDGTGEMAERVMAEHGPAGRVLTHDGLRGPAAARNAGMTGADWYVLLDADDLALPRRIAAIKRTLYDYPDVGFIHHPAVHRWPDGRECIVGTNPTPDLTTGNTISASAVAVADWALDTAGRFDPALVGVEDWALWLRLFATVPTAFIRQPLTVYRATEHGLGLGKPLRHYEDQAALLAASVADVLTRAERKRLSLTLRDWVAWHAARQASPRDTSSHTFSAS